MSKSVRCTLTVCSPHGETAEAFRSLCLWKRIDPQASLDIFKNVKYDFKNTLGILWSCGIISHLKLCKTLDRVQVAIKANGGHTKF